MKQEKLEMLKTKYESASMSAKQLEKMKQEMNRAKMEKARTRKILLAVKSAAAVLAAFIILPNTSANVAYAMEKLPVLGKMVEMVTFRNYHYEDERHYADVDVQAPTVAEEQEKLRETKEKPDIATLKKTTEEISAEIQEITEQIIAEFEESKEAGEGYQQILVDSEAISTTDSYFTLKLICYEGAGSGAQWNYFYTIDLMSGERLALKDLFVEGADYITPISGNIKKQMRQQMEADENIMYWLDDEDMPEWNFRQITEETSFYVNEKNEVVIAFNEGDVAPMYMGCVEFVIPQEVLSEIRR